MFSALKRWSGKGDAAGPPGVPAASRPGHQSMSHNLQRKFARGVQYNMKIIIKGDRNVGKTALFHRLKGEKFIEEYTPTEEIQVASIQWSYKATDDVVKVEVWDVVDRGKKKKRVDGLKLENAGPALSDDIPDEPVLDAEFLDVYKGTNGVIMVMDITKNWTFEYVQRELPKVPVHIPVLVLANHCDMSHHRVVTPDHVTYLIESQQRPEGCAQIRYAESSMRNGFGLKFLHKFLNLPFLQLQRETLLAQLDTNSNETSTTMNELDIFQSGPDADYNQFLENLVTKRRQAAESVSTAGMHAQAFSGIGHTIPGSGGAPHSASSQQLASPTSGSDAVVDASMRRSLSTPGPVGGGQPVGAGYPIGGGQPIGPIGGGHPIPVPTSSHVEGHALPRPAPASATHKVEENSSLSLTQDPSKKQPSFMSKIFGRKETVDAERRPSVAIGGNENGPGNLVSVEEFVPDGGMIDRSFLEDTVPIQAHNNTATHQVVDSDSDTEPSGNPLVAGFQDDIDSDEDLGKPLKGVTIADVEAEDEGEDEGTAAIIQEHLRTKSRSRSSSPSRRQSLSPSQSPSPPNPRRLNVQSSFSEEKVVQEEGSLDGEVLTITGDALDAWFSSDSKLRCSPEGGEDYGSRESRGSRGSRGSRASQGSPDAEVDVSSISGSGSVEKKKKDRHREKQGEEKSSSSKKHKKKSKDKDKEKEKEKDKEKRKKKMSRKLLSEERSRDELEEFLNGSGTCPVESAYEAL